MLVLASGLTLLVITLGITALAIVARSERAVTIWVLAYWCGLLAMALQPLQEPGGIGGLALLSFGLNDLANALAVAGVARLIGQPFSLRLAWGLGLGCLVAVLAATAWSSSDGSRYLALLSLQEMLWFGWLVAMLVRQAAALRQVAWMAITALVTIMLVDAAQMGIFLGQHLSALQPLDHLLRASRPIWSIFDSLVFTGVLLILATHKLMRRLQHQADHDALTGLLNRAAFSRQATALLARSPRNVVLMLDLDHFKQVNDRYGHPLGDRVITCAVDCVRRLAMPAGTLFSRHGGEEFLLLLPGLDRPAALALAAQICQCLADAPIEVDGHRLAITASVGGAQVQGNDLADAIARADRALYRAKGEGRNQVVWAEERPSAN